MSIFARTAFLSCVSACAFAGAAFAQQPAAPAAPTQPQSPDMSFFVTSVGLGKGADLGGLEGADKHCQTLAAGAGAGAKTWRAYLSTQGAGAVNARDRIGKGPWKNFKGVVMAESVDELHKSGGKMGMDNSLTERGTKLPGVGWTPNTHDVLTGSNMEGRAFPPEQDRTCGNWTKSGAGTAMLGHIDRTGLTDTVEAKSWNSAHPSRGPDGGCSQRDLVSTGGAGLLYCFAAN